MKVCLKMKRFNTLIASAVIALAAGHAMAAGNITGVTVADNEIMLGEYVQVSANGNVQLDSLGKGCAVRITLRYSDNTSEVVRAGVPVDSLPQTLATVKPAKVGNVRVTLDGGSSSTVQWPACAGMATTSIQVKPQITGHDISVTKKPRLSTGN